MVVLKDKICPVCDEEIKEDDKKFMLGIDKPYINVWFHRACYKSVESDLLLFLQKNIKKWYNSNVEEVKNG